MACAQFFSPRISMAILMADEVETVSLISKKFIVH